MKPPITTDKLEYLRLETHAKKVLKNMGLPYNPDYIYFLMDAFLSERQLQLKEIKETTV